MIKATFIPILNKYEITWQEWQVIDGTPHRLTCREYVTEADYAELVKFGLI